MRCTFLKIVLAMLLAVSLSNFATATELTFGDWATAEGYTPPGPTDWQCYAVHMGITSADGANLFTNLQSLNLSRNDISSLSANQFQNLTSLLELRLMSNDISSVSSDQFQGLTNLQILSLSRNQIASLSASQFQTLPNLLELNLFDNQISSLSADHFQGLSSLQELQISDNQITSLSANQFQGLGSLEVLYLEGNQITSVDANAFQGLPDLTRLRLDNNQVSSLSANQFQGLGSLVELGLDFNQISSMDSNAFLGLGDMWELSLRNNQVSSLSADQFQGLTNLGYLDLEGNPISSLSANAFRGLGNLLDLGLGLNQISSLDLTGLEATALTAFDIKENPITEVILADATLSQVTFDAVMKGHETNSFFVGVAELAGVVAADFSGADMSGVDQLDEMFAMGDAETLILTDVAFSNAIITAGYAEVWDLVSALEAQQLDALTVNEQLYAAMQINLDTWDAGAGNVLTVVPEPATLSLLALGGLALIRRRRKTKRVGPSRSFA